MTRAYQCFDVETEGDVTLARFRKGNLDEEWVHELGDELLSLIQADGARKLVISFNDMECLYSLLLGKLLRAKRCMDAVQGKVKLCDVPPLAREVFRVCKLDTQFEFAPNKESAMKGW